MDDAVVSGWERALLAAEKVKERLKRSTASLEAGVAYAVVGGNAVAEWVGRIDEDAVRKTARCRYFGPPWATTRGTAAAHGEHEERNGGQHDENWPDWYADYIVKEQAGEPLPV